MTNIDPPCNRQYAARLVATAESSAAAREWCQSDQLFREAISIDDSAASRIAYGNVLFRQERFHEAITIITPVLDGFDLAAIGVVCHNLASIFREVGDLDLARRFQWRATLIQPEASCHELLGMANDALVGERHEAAETLIMAAIELNPDEDGDLIATAGLVDAMGTSPREGLWSLFSAYRTHQRDRDERGMGFDLLNMATMFGLLQRYRTEQLCLERAIRLFERSSLVYSQQRAEQRLASFHRLQALRSFDGRLN